MTDADKLLAAAFAAHDDDLTARWLADVTDVERVDFVREAGAFIVIRYRGEEYAVNPRNIFANPHDAELAHEELRTKYAT